MLNAASSLHVDIHVAPVTIRAFLFSCVTLLRCVPNAKDLAQLYEGRTKLFQVVHSLSGELVLPLFYLALNDSICQLGQPGCCTRTINVVL